MDKDIFMKLEHDLITTKSTHIEHGSINYNAPHNYKIVNKQKNSTLCHIHFQEGPILETDINGIFMEDLIAICINRLEHFQQSEFKCRENAVAITKLEESLMWLHKRTLNRKKEKLRVNTKNNF